MTISYIAVDRIVEDKIKSDEAYRRELERVGRLMLSAGRRMSDGELIEKLQSFGLALDREALGEWSKRFLSAEEIGNWLVDTRKVKAEGMGEDWVWIALTVLWERWFPDRSGFEQIDDRMQEGYKRWEEGGAQAACSIWLRTWRDILDVMDARGLNSIAAFDDLFRGSQYVHNWVGDLDDALGNAGKHEERLRFAEEFLRRFPDEDSLCIENTRRSMAESLFHLGRMAEVESLYQQWLKADPEWGWGWIGWSDCFWLLSKEAEDYERVEDILNRARAVEGVRDKADILERLAMLYTRTGRKEEAERVLAESDALRSAPRLASLEGGESDGIDPDDLPGDLGQERGIAVTRKVGRNDPCPCGSGKKFKKCCGRS